MRGCIIGFVAAAVLTSAIAYWRDRADVRAAGFLPYLDAEAVTAGEAVYRDFCASCHGSELQGEPDWQMRDSEGYLPAPPHDETGHTWHHSDSQLLAITRQGVEPLAGNGYRSRMGGYGDILTEKEMLAVLAYIKSRWPPDIIARHNQINSQASQ